MSTTIEAHHITIDTTLTEEQIPALSAEMGSTCWLINASTLIVEKSAPSESFCLSGITNALRARGIGARFLRISRMVISG